MTGTQEYGEDTLRVARTARVGRVGTLSAATRETWVVLHGYGHLARSFAASATWPAGDTRVFLFPEALQRFYDAEPGTPHATAPVGASWMTREARDDDIADNHAYLDALVTHARGTAPGARLTVLGFSQGGATAARWAAHRISSGHEPPRLILWGAALPMDVDLGENAPLRRLRVEIVIGTRDRWVTPERMSAEQARLDAAKFPIALRRFEGGHRLDDVTLAELVHPHPFGPSAL
ncbi:MAG TPA: hypothetical protein VE967_08715 [Gemmatimonadaceae bacterium]|nr:hypothetical protein [Gemmatimonadaceae bacterium]